jgi:hypothetical protein
VNPDLDLDLSLDRNDRAVGSAPTTTTADTGRV